MVCLLPADPRKGVGLQPLPPGMSPSTRHPVPTLPTSEGSLEAPAHGPEAVGPRGAPAGSSMEPLPEASPQLVAPASQRQRGREGRSPPALLLGVSTAVSEMNLPVSLGTWPGTVRCQRLRSWDCTTGHGPQGIHGAPGAGHASLCAAQPFTRARTHRHTRAHHPETTAAVFLGAVHEPSLQRPEQGLGSLLRVLVAFPSPIQTPLDPHGQPLRPRGFCLVLSSPSCGTETPRFPVSLTPDASKDVPAGRGLARPRPLGPLP